MKKLLLALLLLTAQSVSSQSVLNGSFENTTAPANCTYNVSNTTFNGFMSGSQAFGAYEAIDIVINGCFVNNIPNGSYAVSIANNPNNNTQGEAISLELDQPLTVGNGYEITFKSAAVQYPTVTQGNLLIGVSTSAASFGVVVDTAETVENVWNTYTFSFVATDAVTHITVMPVPGVSSWNCVDEFSITQTCSGTAGTDVITACGSYTWIDGNTYTQDNSTATYTLMNAQGCDSLVTLDLTINTFPNTNVLQSGSTLTADLFGAAYQWLDCDNNYSIINGETDQSYTPATTGDYAVEITLNGCSDTSACYLVDYTGLEELMQAEKVLVKIVDLIGRETVFKPNTPLIFIYSDGTRERVIKSEE